MKVALASPPGPRPYRPGFALAYLYTVLKSRSNTIDVYDLNQAIFNRLWPATEAVLSYSFFNRITALGAAFSKVYSPLVVSKQGISTTDEFSNMEEVFNYIEANEEKYAVLYGSCIDPLISKRYDVLLLTIQHFEQFLSALALIHLLKQKGCTAKICVGGSYVEAYGKLLLSNKGIFEYADYLFSGDIEVIGRRILSAFNGGEAGEESVKSIPGAAYWSGEKVVANEPEYADNADLNQVQPIDYSYIKKYAYYPGGAIIPVMSSKGCYYRKCRFCSNTHFNRTFSFRSAENVFRDMLSANKELGVSQFRLVDESVPPRILKDLAEIIKSRRSNFEWGGSTRFERWFIDKDAFSRLYRGGCRFLFLGLESGSQRVLDIMGKGTSVTTATKIIKGLKAQGIKTHISILLGYPGEEPADISKTEHLVYSLEKYIDIIEVNLFELVYGSQTFDYLVENDLIQLKKVNPFYSTVDYKLTDPGMVASRMLATGTCQKLKRWAADKGKEPSILNITDLFSSPSFHQSGGSNENLSY